MRFKTPLGGRLVLVAALSLATLVATVPASADTTSVWKLGYYTASGRALSMASVTGAPPALATFDFTTPDNTALVITDQGSNKAALLGDDSTSLGVSASFTISNLTGTFTYFGEPSCGGATANVRFFFQTSKSGGFNETQYWWSNPASVSLSNVGGTTEYNLSSAFGGSSGAVWSDFFGHFGTDSNSDGFPGAAGFADAVSNVTAIGLSFGGGCFFENGVGTTDGSGTFTLNTFGVN
jgi:hypothetical protein